MGSYQRQHVFEVTPDAGVTGRNVFSQPIRVWNEHIGAICLHTRGQTVPS
jgi:hypothetical protein